MRIIAGTAKGRTFRAPEGRSTRPTLDRVREAMFGMVQFDVENAKVLDLFAGSGGLGLEALSRGAKSVVFCDNDRKACSLIQENVSTLGFSDRAEVFCSDCMQLLERLAFSGNRFSLVLLDPPYEAGLYEPVMHALVEKRLLLPNCIVLAEHAIKNPLSSVDPSLIAGKPHRYGDVAVTKFVYQEDEI